MAVKMKIPLARPYFDRDELETVVKPVESGLPGQGQFAEEFEGMAASFTRAAYAKAVSSGSAGLYVALKALGTGAGDKVVVPSFAFVDAVNAIEQAGARPVFCDIDINTFTIDASRLDEILDADKSIKAIVAVNLFGLCAELPYIVKTAKGRGVFVVEYLPGGIGARIGDRSGGTFADAGCLSFDDASVITTGEGGMILTNNVEIDGKAGLLRGRGALSVKGQDGAAGSGGLIMPEYDMPGFNCKMTDLQASLGCAQMRKAARIIAARAEVARNYDEAFKDVEGFRSPFVPIGYTHGYGSYVCLYTRGVDAAGYSMKDIDRLNEGRNAMIAELADAGIATRRGAHATHTLGYYRDRYALKSSDFYFSYMADRLTVALPLYAGMNDDEFYYVVEHIKAILRRI